MGSCASVHRNSETEMKFRLSFGSKTDKLVIPPSPVKEKPNNGNVRIDDELSLSLSTTNFKDYGSKEEAFFDSKAWLDSDCEDDFYSVNGEFTPSRGSTPVHSFGTPAIGKVPSENRIASSMLKSSPGKKKLLELFRESMREDALNDENTPDTQNMGNGKKEVQATMQDLLPKSAQSTPYISGPNSAFGSERTMNEDHLSIREKSFKSVQCCLPSLVSSRSFCERRRKTSPAIAVTGKC